MKLHLRTFGCRANQYDGEAVRAMALASGAELVDDPADADVAIFNSCAVTAEAEADLRQQVRRASAGNPALRTVIMGCASALPAREGALALASLPGVTALVAGADLAKVAEATGLGESVGATSHQRGARGLLRIQDGCDEHCTFCTTVLARGRHRSRGAHELVAEAARLAEHHAEIVITGVHIGSYGAETGGSLGALLEQLVREVPAVRFRLSSVEATEVDDRLAEMLTARDGRVAPYLHAPLQSGSDTVLRRMGRHWYSAGAYADAVERIVARRAVFGLGADVITGFPGESDDDHRGTVALVTRLPFTSLHVFPYSPRPGTAALRLPGQVAPALARERARELRALAAAKAAAYRASRRGGEADVVVIRDGDRREGLTEDYLSVIPTGGAAARGGRYRAILAARDGALCADPAPLTPQDPR